ncbi:VOC family protein [Arthrobacter sp. CC3]|jgi:predicted enzyme related to lactoylglutathione lyase|uniref:VOC family protein n=1 Tax=Arthrobacter sp. CC3 TaxID=3029185 RepID=UPI00326473A5
MVQSGFPILVTPDLDRLLAFYRDLLGGKISYSFPAEGPPVYVGLQLGSMALGIGVDSATKTGPDGQRISLWFYVDDCDATVESLRSGGATITKDPQDQPWGERVAYLQDPDGNLVVVATGS